MRIQNGSLFLFRLFGIPVYLHWLWFLIAYFEIVRRQGEYSSVVWNALEYVTLFAIVLMHEFGHSLACKSVGGKAMDITLWPLGGIARVAPPQRAGAYLWSIAAGPLVNVALVPILYVAMMSVGLPVEGEKNDLKNYLEAINYVNAGLLVFNILPIFPLDGGQILRGILWFILGAGKSLMIAAWIGLGVSVAGIVVFLSFGNLWLVIISGFALMQSYNAIRVSKMIRVVEKAPPNMWFVCPGCKQHPPVGEWWTCGCGAPFDPFSTRGICGRCGNPVETISCPHCHERFPAMFWLPNRPG